jgi:uncharacterized damage-inducible protein DinB
MIYPDFYASYINLVSTENKLSEELEIQLYEAIKFVQNIPMDKFDYIYAPGKWNIKEILQHLIDCERIFAYRALAIARNDKQSLLLFDENLYANTVSENAKNRHLKTILEDWTLLRQSNIQLLKSFTKEDLNRVGNIGENPISVGAIFYIMLGHQLHHINVYKERYL